EEGTEAEEEHRGAQQVPGSQAGAACPGEHIVEPAHPSPLRPPACRTLPQGHPDEEQTGTEAGADEQSVLRIAHAASRTACRSRPMAANRSPRWPNPWPRTS